MTVLDKQTLVPLGVSVVIAVALVTGALEIGRALGESDKEREITERRLASIESAQIALTGSISVLTEAVNAGFNEASLDRWRRKDEQWITNEWARLNPTLNKPSIPDR